VTSRTKKFKAYQILFIQSRVLDLPHL